MAGGGAIVLLALRGDAAECTIGQFGPICNSDNAVLLATTGLAVAGAGALLFFIGEQRKNIGFIPTVDIKRRAVGVQIPVRVHF